MRKIAVVKAQSIAPPSENDLLIEQAYEAMSGGTADTADGAEVKNTQSPTKWQKWKENFKKRGWILVFILPALIYVLIFCYGPMYGIVVAFQEYQPGNDIIGPDTVWVGFKTLKISFPTELRKLFFKYLFTVHTWLYSRVSAADNRGAFTQFRKTQKR